MTSYHKAQWNESYTNAKAYFDEHGNIQVNKKTHKKLYDWICKQRMNQPKLYSWQKKKLDAIGMLWQEDREKILQQKWDDFLGNLLAFKDEYGHTRVPSKPVGEMQEKYAKLGRKVEVVRSTYWELSREKKEDLKKVGFVISERISSEQDRRWQKRFEELQEFYDRFGHSNVPEYWSENEQLAIWVAYQRVKKKRHSKDQRALLESVNFEFNPQKKGRPRDDKGRFYSSLDEDSDS